MNKYGLNITWSEEDQGYIATCPEFPGLSAFGETFEDAVAEAKLAQELFIETFESEGIALPEPRSVDVYSGQFRLRIPSTLHGQLAKMADLEGVSLNQFVLAILSARVGGEQMSKKFEAWLERMEQRLIKRTAANDAEYVVALMQAWNHSSYEPLRQRSTSAFESGVFLTETKELEMV
jgi:predicted RNase H-like HicB family nuclease